MQREFWYIIVIGTKSSAAKKGLKDYYEIKAGKKAEKEIPLWQHTSMLTHSAGLGWLPLCS